MNDESEREAYQAAIADQDLTDRDQAVGWLVWQRARPGLSEAKVETERTLFEAWPITRNWDTTTIHDTNGSTAYANHAVQRYFDAWLASADVDRLPPLMTVPESDTNISTAETVEVTGREATPATPASPPPAPPQSS